MNFKDPNFIITTETHQRNHDNLTMINFQSNHFSSRFQIKRMHFQFEVKKNYMR